MHMCHLRTTYDMDLAQTANKGYWRDFGIFCVFSILAYAAGVFLVGILFVFEVDIQQVIFFVSDKRENNAGVVGKPACATETF